MFAAHLPLLSLLSVLAAGGCHLGRPPVSAGGVGVAVRWVVAPVAEAAIADNLRLALSDALVLRQAHGTRPLDVVVTDARTESVGATGQLRVHRVVVRLDLQLYGDQPRSVVLQGERSYEVSVDDALGAAQARADATAELTRQLADDAVLWLAYLPEGTAP